MYHSTSLSELFNLTLTLVNQPTVQFIEQMIKYVFTETQNVKSYLWIPAPTRESHNRVQWKPTSLQRYTLLTLLLSN